VRVTGGALKGRKLFSTKGLAIRPTTDYIRESVFNILAGCTEHAIVLDLFAGTGSLGIEALSRGAASAVFVDKHSRAIDVLVRNISLCSLNGQCTVVKRDVLKGLSLLKSMGVTFDLVFVDPPYDKGFAKPTLQILGRAKCTAEETLIVIEHSTREALPQKIANFGQIDQRRHGKTFVSFYQYAMKRLARNGEED
jgi:16S rRNA (guanine966-N2)-methyltransferase